MHRVQLEEDRQHERVAGTTMATIVSRGSIRRPGTSRARPYPAGIEVSRVSAVAQRVQQRVLEPTADMPSPNESSWSQAIRTLCRLPNENGGS